MAKNILRIIAQVVPRLLPATEAKKDVVKSQDGQDCCFCVVLFLIRTIVSSCSVDLMLSDVHVIRTQSEHALLPFHEMSKGQPLVRRITLMRSPCHA